MGKAIGGISIDVGVQISEETINRCITILNWWLKDNPDKTLKVMKMHDLGEIERQLYITTEENE